MSDIPYAPFGRERDLNPPDRIDLPEPRKIFDKLVEYHDSEVMELWFDQIADGKIDVLFHAYRTGNTRALFNLFDDAAENCIHWELEQKYVEIVSREKEEAA